MLKQSHIYLINIVCLKEEVKGIKETLYNRITKDNNIITSIAVNSITPDKFRINIKVGSGHDDDYFVKLTNDIFDMNVLSVTYEKTES